MEQVRFDGRVVLVTGAGRGLGRAHARLLGARGASVVVNDPGVRLDGTGGDDGPARDVAAEIVADGGKAVPDFGSVTSEQHARAMIARALDAFGRIDAVVNNAGNFLPARPFEETSGESFASILGVHLMGTVNVTRAAWPHFRAQGYGRVVNTASHSGYLGAHGQPEYAAAKTAIHGLTRALAYEAAEHGIAVNAIAPGARTRPVADQYPEFPEELAHGAFAPELVSPVVAWLAHEDCPVNGESFTAIAGTTARITIAETAGYVSRLPTPEAIRDHFDEILGEDLVSASPLTFPSSSVEHGGHLIARYERAG